jgi:hypothetical protein
MSNGVGRTPQIIVTAGGQPSGSNCTSSAVKSTVLIKLFGSCITIAMTVVVNSRNLLPLRVPELVSSRKRKAKVCLHVNGSSATTSGQHAGDHGYG